jgi:hypothetical protein
VGTAQGFMTGSGCGERSKEGEACFGSFFLYLELHYTGNKILGTHGFLCSLSTWKSFRYLRKMR